MRSLIIGVVADIKKGENIVKKPSIGGPTRKRLMDISNLQNQKPNLANQDAKHQSTKVVTEEYVDKLHKVYLFTTLYHALIFVFIYVASLTF